MITGVKINQCNWLTLWLHVHIIKNIYYRLHSITWRKKNVINYSWLQIPKSATILYMYHGGQFYDTHESPKVVLSRLLLEFGEGGGGG